MYHFRNRYLDPAAGRFVSRDPLGLWGDASNAGNGYTFAGNDPVNKVDPFGLEDSGAWTLVGFITEVATEGIGNSLRKKWEGVKYLTSGEAVRDIAKAGLDILNGAPTTPTIPGVLGTFLHPSVAPQIMANLSYWANVAQQFAWGLLTAVPNYVAGLWNMYWNTNWWSAEGWENGFDLTLEGVDWGLAFLSGGRALAAKFGIRFFGTRGARAVLQSTICFLEGTLVETREGKTPIEEIEIGDEVLSRDEKTGEQAFKCVTRLFRGHTKSVVYVQISGPESKSEDPQTIRCTEEHPFWVDGKGWIPAARLEIGDILLGSRGERLSIVGHAVRNEEADHYNFEVEGWHTYFVSERDSDPAVWVHNKCPTLGTWLGEGAFGVIYTNADEAGTVVKVYRSQQLKDWPNLAREEHQALLRARETIGSDHVITSRAPEAGQKFLVRTEVTRADKIPCEAAEGWKDLADQLGDAGSVPDAHKADNWVYGTTPDNAVERWILVDDPGFSSAGSGSGY